MVVSGAVNCLQPVHNDTISFKDIILKFRFCHFPEAIADVCARGFCLRKLNITLNFRKSHAINSCAICTYERQHSQRHQVYLGQ